MRERSYSRQNNNNFYEPIEQLSLSTLKALRSFQLLKCFHKHQGKAVRECMQTRKYRALLYSVLKSPGQSDREHPALSWLPLSPFSETELTSLLCFGPAYFPNHNISKLFYFPLCVYCICAPCTHACTYVSAQRLCVHVQRTEMLGVPLSHPLYYYLEAGFLPRPISTGLVASKLPGSTCLHLSVLELQVLLATPCFFYMGPGDPNSGPHVCRVSALTQ